VNPFELMIKQGCGIKTGQNYYLPIEQPKALPKREPYDESIPMHKRL